MGAHPVEVDGIAGTYFAVWAPNARNVSVLGNFNGWDGRHHQMRNTGGIWELFIPELATGELYKYEVKDPQGAIHIKSDPYGFQQEVRPSTASIVSDLAYEWHDEAWLNQRRHQDPQEQPISVYEVHLGSWLHDSFDNPPPQGQAVAVGDKHNTRFLTYRELADRLIPYVKAWATPTLRCCRSPSTPLTALGATRWRATLPPRRASVTPRPDVFRRPVSPKRHWGDRRLGAGSFPQGRPRPRPL
jgi:1,4-alpha-glucan branching enzyme